MTEHDIGSVFKPDGEISAHYENYEFRPQQVAMAEGVWNALSGSEHLIVEAGTGVGKSFAYLVPAITFAVAGQQPVIISTRTLNLQDQLTDKDIPFLKKALSLEFTARVLKGRSNYLCLRRLAYADNQSDKNSLIEDNAEQFEQIKEWSMETPAGTRDALPFQVDSSLWGEVCAESSACRGRKCRYFKNCFYYYAKSQLAAADVVIVNHSLYFSDMTLNAEPGGGLLPEHSHVIFDEAHTIEEAASSHLGTRVSNFQVSHILRGLYNPEKHTGLLTDLQKPDLLQECRFCHIAATGFFEDLEGRARSQRGDREQVWELNSSDEIDSVLCDRLSDLAASIRKECRELDEESDFRAELELRHLRLVELAFGIRTFTVREDHDNYVHWIEYGGGASRKVVSLNRVPLDISRHLQESIFSVKDSVILTGATIGVTLTSGFDYFTRKLGLEDCKGIRLDSPFNYEENVKLYVARSLSSPQKDLFNAQAADKLRDLLPEFQGGTLLLFTSYASMNRFAEDLSSFVTMLGRTVLVQGQEQSRSRLLEEFQAAGNAVLFATSSFWMGVDVPGTALSNVVIMRLPFAVPNHPLIKGKCRLIKERGENPFLKYSLPEAILTFRQGVGRLLRSEHDTGNIVVFDSRMANARYGKYFFQSIPKCPVEYF